MRIASLIVALSGFAAATTLQQLSTDDMIRQSTAIVRVQVTGSAPVLRGRNIYTQYQFTVLETLNRRLVVKVSLQAAVSVPAGAMQGIRQMVAGAPVLASGQQYVIFLWTSKSGLTQVIGLSQGLVQRDAGFFRRRGAGPAGDGRDHGEPEWHACERFGGHNVAERAAYPNSDGAGGGELIPCSGAVRASGDGSPPWPRSLPSLRHITSGSISRATQRRSFRCR